jgi:chaperonin GroES
MARAGVKGVEIAPRRPDRRSGAGRKSRFFKRLISEVLCPFRRQKILRQNLEGWPFDFQIVGRPAARAAGPTLPLFCTRRIRMKFRPLHDRVVVRRIDADEKTAGGIIIPDTAKEKPMEGEVIAVGPGGRDESGKLVPLDLKAGDRILFGKWSGTEVKIDGEELLIMKESDVMGVLDKKPSLRRAA